MIQIYIHTFICKTLPTRSIWVDDLFFLLSHVACENTKKAQLKTQKLTSRFCSSSLKNWQFCLFRENIFLSCTPEIGYLLMQIKMTCNEFFIQIYLSECWQFSILRIITYNLISLAHKLWKLLFKTKSYITKDL